MVFKLVPETTVPTIKRSTGLVAQKIFSSLLRDTLSVRVVKRTIYSTTVVLVLAIFIVLVKRIRDSKAEIRFRMVLSHFLFAEETKNSKQDCGKIKRFAGSTGLDKPPEHATALTQERVI